ncbi:MAG: hypothetical protein K1W09_02170 [Akkermansia muciniphila]|uniref:hypothetical protein n=1 Tax=uncultured Akkermansia sp. TaxID=512294 RepID=UPI0026119AE2|nr:hypothetical protein [uncultured Akkermansia sp.]
MNTIPTVFSFLIMAACGAGAYAADINAPQSISGATIKLNGAIYNPGDITIERYEPDKNTARLVMRHEQQLMPRISSSASLTGAATEKEVHGEKVKPALVTFTGQKGRVYSGIVSGSLYRYSCNRGEEDQDITILKNEAIEFVFPEDDRPREGVIKGPETLKGAVIQIRTDKRSFTVNEGCGFTGTQYFLKYPDEKTAGIDLSLPKDPENPNVSLWMAGEGNLQELMAADAPLPHIAFTRKLSDKIYEGSLFGYLYGYTEAPPSENGQSEDYVIKFKEKLLSITIVLP